MKLNGDQRYYIQIKRESNRHNRGKGKGKVHPVTGHEDPERG
jgi:hypothetical protein